jgi:hypothetical protein
LAPGSSQVTNYDAAVTYVFTPLGPAVDVSGAITGMTNGTSYTLVASQGGCNSSPSATFVNGAQTATPSIPAVSSSAASCSADGISTILNYDAGLIYIFSPLGPTVGSGGVVSGMVSGTSYTLAASDGNCSSAPSVSFSNEAQFPTPTASISGTLSYCIGSNTTLTASGGVSYVWSDASASIIGSNPSVTVTQGSYAVIATDANGCTAAASATVTEISSLAVNISGALTYCPGGSTTITASGGANYIWNDVSNSTTAAITVTLGTYSVTASDLSGCTGTASTTVTEWNSFKKVDKIFVPLSSLFNLVI